MLNALVLESSLLPSGMSVSRRVGGELVDALQSAELGLNVIRRDLAADPLPHIGLDLMAGSMSPPESRTEAQAHAVAVSDTLIGELFAADYVVIEAPMYNFTIPSTLKAWIDNVAIAGKTFRYGADGRPEGLVTGKRVFLIVTRGGAYSEGPMAAFNFTDPYLRAALGLLGMTDVTIVTAEMQKMGPEAAAQGDAQASREIRAAVAA
jgi:FMN-dependent NADH-azoreductase